MPTYKMKDLGYERTPTTAMMRVEFENGEWWEFPAQVVADDRDGNYADEKEDTVGAIKKGLLDDYDLTDWAANNMHWPDVRDYARKVDRDREPFDHETKWGNAPKTIERGSL